MSLEENHTILSLHSYFPDQRVILKKRKAGYQWLPTSASIKTPVLECCAVNGLAPVLPPQPVHSALHLYKNNKKLVALIYWTFCPAFLKTNCIYLILAVLSLYPQG